MQKRMDEARAGKFAAIWLLNPMVATISTRGSSEGLLAVMVVALLWAVLARRVTLAALLLGCGVHFKIYPFIYAPAIVWWMDDDNMRVNNNSDEPKQKPNGNLIMAFFTAPRLKLALLSLSAFSGLNIAMYAMYGHSFLQHTYLHHVTRIDHRHNFSPYNILLYLVSARSPLLSSGSGGLDIESLAFVPQLLLSCVVIPFVMAKKDLPTTMLAQTWTFVTFNKVCTSQVCLRPFLLPLFRTREADQNVVLPLVPHLPPPLPPQLLLPPPPQTGYRRPRPMGAHPGGLAAAGLPTRVFGREHIPAWPLAVEPRLLFGELLDFRGCC